MRCQSRPHPKMSLYIFSVCVCLCALWILLNNVTNLLHIHVYLNADVTIKVLCTLCLVLFLSLSLNTVCTGFIDYIISPIFDVCGDMLELILTSEATDTSSTSYCRPWLNNLTNNRKKWTCTDYCTAKGINIYMNLLNPSTVISRVSALCLESYPHPHCILC